MSTTRGRLVAPNTVVYDQAEFFQWDGYTRILGITIPSLILQVYLNNTLLDWTLVDGSTTSESQVASGKVYFHALPSGPYSLRWRPNAIGYWRVTLNYPLGQQILAQDYDVSGSGTTATIEGGLHTSFIKPGDRHVL